MAKESEELPVSLEVRRFSTGKSSSGNTGEKIVSYYLKLLLVPAMIFVNMGGSMHLKQRNGELVVG